MRWLGDIGRNHAAILSQRFPLGRAERNPAGGEDAGRRVSPRPVLMTVAVAAAAAFLTPVATPTNLMVMEPGGYRFGDYWKFGLPMMIWFFVIAVFAVPLIWPF